MTSPRQPALSWNHPIALLSASLGKPPADKLVKILLEKLAKSLR